VAQRPRGVVERCVATARCHAGEAESPAPAPRCECRSLRGRVQDACADP
jgi:hypothetical protein